MSQSKQDEVVLSVALSRGDIMRPAMILLGFVALFWAIEIIDWATGSWLPLDSFGIRPWNIGGLLGIFFAPFLHGGFAHVAANSVPFIILGGLVMLRSRKEFWIVSIIVMLISGIGTWLTGSPRSLHIGASGIVFGYFGYLLLLGYFERSWTSILRAILVGFLYGGLIWGVLPLQTGISWQGHLFGFIGGVFAAYLLANRFNLIDKIQVKDSDSGSVEDQIKLHS